MERFYRLLLQLYPRDVRRQFAGDMRRTFRDLLARERAGGVRAVLRLCLREAAEIGRDALGERLRRASLGRLGGFLQSLLQDLRLAVRGLRSKPGLTVVVVLTLALAVGANASVFSIVQATLLRPLPFPDSQQLVMMWEDRSARGGSPKEWVEWPLFRELTKRRQTFAAAGVFQVRSGALTSPPGREAALEVETGPLQRTSPSPGEAASFPGGFTPPVDTSQQAVRASRPVTVAEVSSGFLKALQVAPLLGRGFRLGKDDRPQAPRQVILSERLWKSAFAADENVPGGQVLLDQEEATIIGVLPDLDVPELQDADLWLNLRADERSYPMGHFTLRALGRLTPGTPLPAAQRQLNQDLQQAAEADGRFAEIGVRLSPMAEEIQPKALRQGLLLMMLAATCLLLAGCANIAGLLLGRVLNRRPEMALRSALGGGRLRILRLALTESLLLALLGGAAGWMVAWMSGSLLAGLAPPGLLPADAWPQAASVSGWPEAYSSTALFTLAVSVLAGFLFGLLPALHLARWPAAALASARGPLTQPGHPRLRAMLVAGQVSLALLLLIASGLLMRSFDRLMQVGLGFDPQDRIAFHLETPDARQAERLIARLPEVLRADPQIDRAALVSPLPLSGVDTDIDLAAVPAHGTQPGPDDGRSGPVWYRRIDAGYLNAMDIPVLAGRGLDEDDLRQRQRVAVVSQSAADFFWPGQSPLGRRLSGGDWAVQVVGVIAGVRHKGLRQSPRPEIYLPASMVPDGAIDVVILSSAPLVVLKEKIRQHVLELAPASAVSPPVSLGALAQEALALPRFLTVLTSAFAILALLCALLGIASSLTSYVQGRRGELGLRLALGARRRHLFTAVLARGLTLAGTGLVIGWMVSLAASGGLSEGLGEVLFRTTASDSATYLLVSILLVSFSLAASLIPAWQASRADPLRTLRE